MAFRSTSEITNVARHLPIRAASLPDRVALSCPAGEDRDGERLYDQWTFSQLDLESNRIAAGLEAVGIGRGVRTVLMVPPSLEFFALTFALFKVGAVPVFVDPGMGIANLGNCLTEAEPEAFIGVRKAHLARRLLGWGRKSLRTFVGVRTPHWLGGTSLRQIREHGARREGFQFADTQPEETAAILFTSGSTGIPKGAVYRHEVFCNQVELLRDTYDIREGEVDVCTFPLFALFAPALGMSAVIPQMDATRPAEVDPLEVIGPIQKFRATNLFGSPALLNRVGRYAAEHHIKLPSLKRVLSAGAPVPPVVLERFASLLSSSTQIFTPYGATECLPVSSIGSDEILQETRYETERGRGVCVGRVVKRMTVHVIAVQDDPIAEWSESLPLPPGEVGEIVVTGPVATHAYFGRPEETARGKIVDNSSGTIYHRMGDLGYFDEQGRLWFCGRKAHRVETANGRMLTVPVEAIFNTHPDVFRSALVGVGPRGNERPVLCVELESDRKRRDRITLIDELRSLAARHEQTQRIDTFLIHRKFPVDIRHNSKIFREKLATWAARQLKT